MAELLHISMIGLILLASFGSSGLSCWMQRRPVERRPALWTFDQLLGNVRSMEPSFSVSMVVADCNEEDTIEAITHERMRCHERE